MTNLTLRPPLPRSLYLETTSRCNSLCETCILTFGGREPAKDLAWEEFRTVVDQFPALDRVLLHGIGEPLLNRHLAPMVAHLKRREAQVIFNTNAITLDGRVADALIEARPRRAESLARRQYPVDVRAGARRRRLREGRRQPRAVRGPPT